MLILFQALFSCPECVFGNSHAARHTQILRKRLQGQTGEQKRCTAAGSTPSMLFTHAGSKKTLKDAASFVFLCHIVCYSLYIFLKRLSKPSVNL